MNQSKIQTMMVQDYKDRLKNAVKSINDNFCEMLNSLKVLAIEIFPKKFSDCRYQPWMMGALLAVEGWQSFMQLCS